MKIIFYKDRYQFCENENQDGDILYFQDLDSKKIIDLLQFCTINFKEITIEQKEELSPFSKKFWEILVNNYDFCNIKRIEDSE